jgi:osmotically-inducible protein OsmY
MNIRMTTKSKSILAIAAIGVAGAAASIAMYSRHSGPAPTSHVEAQAVTDGDFSNALKKAGLPVADLLVQTVGDITVIRGEAPDTETITKAGQILKDLGARRVANLIHVPIGPDDDAIRREAERQLARSRALDGCKFAVSCNRGVLKVNATVQSELQADAARSLLNNVDGVQRVEMALAR